MEEKWKDGLFTVEMLKQWSDQGAQDKILSAVPVVSAWNSAMRKAEEGGYVFKVPKFQPRNPKNSPDQLESRVLKHMRDKGLNEYYEINSNDNSVHYFRAVYLTETCLYCHGSPSKSNRILGQQQRCRPNRCPHGKLEYRRDARCL